MNLVKPWYSSKTVWASVVAFISGLLSHFNVNIGDLAPQLVDGILNVISLGSIVGAIIARFKATHQISVAPGSFPQKVASLALVPFCLAALGLTSCATTGSLTTDEVSSLTSVAVSNGLQFGIKDSAQRSEVAGQMTQVSTIYTTYGNGTVPTPEQFQALLNQYLPAGSTKALTISNLTALYTFRYSGFKDLKLPDQLGYLTSFLQGVKLGAAPFVLAP